MNRRIPEKIVLGAATIAALAGCFGFGGLIGSWMLDNNPSIDQATAIGVVLALAIGATVYIWRKP